MKKRFKILPLILICVLCLFTFAACNVGPDKNVVLDKGNGEQLEEIYIASGETYSLGRPTRAGYTFVAWYDAQTGGSALTDNRGESNGLTWNTNEKTTVYARWTANSYVIKLDYQGATAGNSVATVNAIYDEEISTFPVPVKSGSDFAGWYTAASGGAQASGADGVPTAAYKTYKAPVYTSMTGEENATVLYAHWVVAKMTINFEANGGTAVVSQQKDAGSIIDVMPLTAQDNKAFAGWYVDANLVEKAEFPYTVPYNYAKTITLYAKYEEATTDYLNFTSINQDKEYRASLSNFTYTGAMILPDMYFGKKVTAVGSFAGGKFSSITVPHSVTTIAANAFENCTSLTTVTLSQSITAIPAAAFRGCSVLAGVTIPVTVTNIGDNAFSNTGFTAFAVSAKIGTIGNGILSGCANLATITVAEGNTTFIAIDDVLYRNYGSYYHLVMYASAKTAATYEIETKTQRILDYAFAGAKSLKTITIGGNISTIGAYAFADCPELYKVDISLARPTGITPTIGDNAFNGCGRLKAVIVRNTQPITLGGNNVFANVSNVFTIYVPTANVSNYASYARWSSFAGKIFGLSEIFGDFAIMDISGGCAIRQYLGRSETVSIPAVINGKQVKAINEKAFAYSDTLKNVVIPQYVTSIGNQAFAYCAALESVYMEPATPPALNNAAFSNTNNTFNIYVASEVSIVNAYRNAQNWSSFSSRIFSRSD